MNLCIRLIQTLVMRKLILITMALTIPTFLFFPSAIFGETVQVQLTIRADVRNVSKLELNSTTVQFELGRLNPDVAPMIESAASQITVQCKARASSNSDVSLTILAADDLISGSDTISINNIKWIASGNGFINGTLDKISPQAMGAWKGGGVFTGIIFFRLNNRWEYSSGDYITTALLTLTVP